MSRTMSSSFVIAEFGWPSPSLLKQRAIATLGLKPRPGREGLCRNEGAPASPARRNGARPCPACHVPRGRGASRSNDHRKVRGIISGRVHDCFLLRLVVDTAALRNGG